MINNIVLQFQLKDQTAYFFIYDNSKQFPTNQVKKLVSDIGEYSKQHHPADKVKRPDHIERIIQQALEYHEVVQNIPLYSKSILELDVIQQATLYGFYQYLNAYLYVIGDIDFRKTRPNDVFLGEFKVFDVNGIICAHLEKGSFLYNTSIKDIRNVLESYQ